MPKDTAQEPNIDNMMKSGLILNPDIIAQKVSKIPENGSADFDIILDGLEKKFQTDEMDMFTDLAENMLALLIYRAKDKENFANELTMIESMIADSPIITEDLKTQLIDSFKRSGELFFKSTETNESNEREQLADFLRKSNVKDLHAILKVIFLDPKLRRKLRLTKDERKLITNETFKQPNSETLEGYEISNIGELQKILSPLFAKMIQDKEIRYYLNLAIDEASRTKSEENLDEIEKQQGFYYPALVIGFGVYGQVVNNEIMHALPECQEKDILTVDGNNWIGGQFARGNKPVFNVNNRVRPQKTGSKAQPGTKDNIMPVGTHSVVDLPMVSSKTYPSQNLLGTVLKTNGYLNSRNYVLNCRVTGYSKNTDQTRKGKYVVSFFDQKTNKAYQVCTDTLVVGDGIGKENFGFEDKFDPETRRIVAESKKKIKSGEKPSIILLMTLLESKVKRTVKMHVKNSLVKV